MFCQLVITSEKFTRRNYLYWITAQKRIFDVFQHTLAKSGACWERHHWNMVKQLGKTTRRSKLRLFPNVFFHSLEKSLNLNLHKNLNCGFCKHANILENYGSVE